MAVVQDEQAMGPDHVAAADAFLTTKIDGCVKLRIPERGAGEAPEKFPPVSVPALLRTAAKEAPNSIALGVKRNDKWINWTYSDYLKEVECVARAFIKLGLEERRAVAIMGFNSPEWFISDLSAVFCNAVAVGIYATNSPEAMKYIAAHCHANIIVVENDAQLQKVLKVKDELPDLKAIVQYTGTPTNEDVLSWSALLKLGEDGKNEEELKKRLSNVRVNQCCHLVYTSGTTGTPKGVMLSHDNLTFTSRALADSYGLKMGVERIVSYLPLSHVAANLLDLVVLLSVHGTTYFADKNALKGSLNYTLKETLPTIFFGVPRVWEKFQEKMTQIGDASKGLKRQITNWAKKTGLKQNHNLLNRGASGCNPFGFKIANKLVFQRVKVALGLNKCKVFAVAAAPFSQATFEYFLSLDINVMEIYGLSESSGPHTISTSGNQVVGSTGRTMQGCKTKIEAPEGSESGEVLMSGRHVMMGYLEMEDQTNDCLENSFEGWLRTGDVGFENADGFLTITGRSKEILITAGGENVPPVPIEDSVKLELPCISNCMLIGDKKKFLSCFLTLKVEVDPDTIKPSNKLSPSSLKWLSDYASVSSVSTIDELLDGPDYPAFAKAVQKGIDAVNASALSNAQKVQKWKILRKDFSVPGGELGPTLKLKRHQVLEQNKDAVERLYG